MISADSNHQENLLRLKVVSRYTAADQPVYKRLDGLSFRKGLSFGLHTGNGNDLKSEGLSVRLARV